MSPEEIAFIADLVRRRSGVIVHADKIYLIESRLGPVARREGFASIHEMIRSLAQTRDEGLIWQMVECMASIETQFFRDRIPFDQLRKDILPRLAERSRDPVRIWSAGCATGQEPYSIAMLAEEDSVLAAGQRLEIIASDLSERCLEKARTGLYTQFEVQRGLPSRLLIKHFEKAEDAWLLSPRLRQLVHFERLNLLNRSAQAGAFDVIFCRNVLSAFDDSTRKTVLEQLALALTEDGFLILGAQESVGNLTPAFHPVSDRRGLFKRNPAFRIAA